MRTLKLSIPHLPDPDLSPNARVHYMVKSKAVRVAREEVGWLAKAQWHDEKPMMCAMISYEFTLSTKRLRDEDNLLSSCKPWQDGLVDAGVIFYDNAKHLTTGKVQVTQGDKEETVILVQEVVI